MGFMVQKSLLVASSLLVFCLTIESWILRLTCKKEADFIIVVRDFILENNVVGRHTTTDYLQCIVECVRNNNCKSLNYNEIGGKENCQLNGNIKEKAEADFKPKAGWVYHSTDYNTTNIGSVCETLNPCKGQYCVDTCSQKGFRCFQCDKWHEMSLEQNCVLKNLSNIAYLKATSQSSVEFSGSSGSSARAVDGNKDGNFKHHSCTHTLRNTRFSWWRVDFGKEATVHSVAITNRADCCSHRLGKFDILVGSNTANGGNSNQVCRNNLSMTVPGTMLFKCQANRIGQYLYIKNQLTDALTLCEVEVFGVL